jgi:NADH-quinone oxidoreductase subunit A
VLAAPISTVVPMSTETLAPYAGVLVVIAFATVVAGAILGLTHLVGPKRRGPVKDESYESGMPPIADARRRFRVRFYMVAVLFLLFDVEVALLWPWAPVFNRAASRGEAVELPTGASLGTGFLLGAMGLFLALLVVGFLYEWRKGVFRWD